MPKALVTFLESHAGTIRQLYAQKKAAEEASPEDDQSVDLPDALGPDDLIPTEVLSLADFHKALAEAARQGEDQPEEFWSGMVEKITAFGPRRIGLNMLFDSTNDQIFRKLYYDLPLVSNRC